MQVTPYLYFRGACEDALKFYQSCGIGEIRLLWRYEGTPMAERDGGVWGDKVLHSLFEGPGLRLFAGDGPDSEPMKGSALLIEENDLEKAQALFATLSAGGRVTVSFKQQSWGDTYGNFTDKFGVQWAVNSSAR
jgi:PhnB protein